MPAISRVAIQAWATASHLARLHANDDFNAQLKKAKEEFEKLKKAGKIQKVIVE